MMTPRPLAAPLRSCPRRAFRAFTLVELLTVMSIIAILAAILFPTVSTVMQRARAAISASNLKSIGGAMTLYQTTSGGYLPAPLPGGAGLLANPYNSNWQVEIVPLLDGMVDPNTKQVKVWPKPLKDPEFEARESGISDPTKRGYGMNPFLYRPSNLNTDTRTQRQKFDNLPDPPNNVLVGCSNTTTLEADIGGLFKNQDTGDPKRFNGMAPYLFLDGSVRILAPEEVQNALSMRSPNRSGHALVPGG